MSELNQGFVYKNILYYSLKLMVEFGLNLMSQMKSQTYLKMIGRRVDTNQDIDRNDGNNSNLKKISFSFTEQLF